jgi:tRNA1(Val) A37 N6-methylase TrmN6
MIYGTRSNGNLHGTVLTKPIVVDAMLDMVGYFDFKNLSSVKIVEPAAGDGAYAIPIIERLYNSSINFGFSFQNALNNVHFCEMDEAMSNTLKERIIEKLNDYSSVLPESMIITGDFLLADISDCDIVVGNPPYVRHENIPDEKKVIYRKIFGTFSHRSDIYIAFFEKSLRALKQEGVLSFICSNRWIKNQYGEKLRKFIGLNFSLEEIIDLEETNPFEENVIAYPAIATIRKSKNKIVPKYYKLDNLNNLKTISKSQIKSRILNLETHKNWFQSVKNGHPLDICLDSIINQGFRIGIGVATGADDIFIGKDLADVIDKDVLLPIITSKDLKGNKINWSGNYLINPFSDNNHLINLEKYQKTRDYFYSNKSRLICRHISKKNPDKWYSTIDKIDPELTFKDKILIPDISGNSKLFIDRGNYYPHHNLYYITGCSYTKLELLAAVMMSDFVKDQLKEIGNKMNGGYPRWQSQNLKKLRIPIIDAIPENISQTLIEAYRNSDQKIINRYINVAEIMKFNKTVGQTRLF